MRTALPDPFFNGVIQNPLDATSGQHPGCLNSQFVLTVEKWVVHKLSSKITFILQPEPFNIRTMENLLFLLATSFVLRLSSPRSFKNHLIGDTGCRALLIPADNTISRTKTESGDDLYFHDTTEAGVTYGIICVCLQQQYSLEEASEMLGSYMEKLHQPFFIRHNVGQQNGADWNSYHTKTIVDYWQDGDGCDWKVKGYTNGSILAVLYVRNIAQLEVTKQDLYLDSFHFGE
jgi:hypothetical protein